MIDVNFNRNRRNALSEIKFENMQGMNCVDNNSVLPAHQVPYAFNVDFGRHIGAASKRFGLESTINETADFISGNGVIATPVSAIIGQTWTTGTGVTSISSVVFKKRTTDLSVENTTVSIYTDPTKTTLVGSTTNVRIISSLYLKAVFTPPLTISAATQYYIEITSTSSFNLMVSLTNQHTGKLYINGSEDTGHDLHMTTYYDLGPTGILSQHCFRSTAGDIPLIAHGTDLYKLSGASTTRTTDTEAEFNAGTLTDVVVLADITAPSTAVQCGAYGTGSLNGDYYGKVTFVDESGAESDFSPISLKVSPAGSTGILWSSIPTGGAGIMQRKIYRTKAGGSVFYLLTTIDDNTTTSYQDSITDASLTVQLIPKRVILDYGDAKGTAVVAQTATDVGGTNFGTTGSMGQTFLTSPGITKIYSISAGIYYGFAAGEKITLTLYDSIAKSNVLGSKQVTGPGTNVEFIFSEAITVTPNTTYYFELTKDTGGLTYVHGTAIAPTYEHGGWYANGSLVGGDMTFSVYGCKYATEGTYESEVIDLATAPTQATLTFNQTLNSQTVAWYAKCSTDNVVWGDWQAVILSGDGIPLGRYIKIKAVLGSDGTATPAVTDYMISHNSGFGTATSIKGSLSGSKVRFTDWDDRVWFCDGVKNYVYDGGFVIAPETVPTVAVSGSGAITGVYNCKVAYVNSDGTEGLPCTAVAVTASSDAQFDWSDIPTTLGYTRKLYRTKAGGTIYYLVATLNATDTTYTDTTADASLTTAIETHTGHNVLELGSGSTKPPASTIIHIHKNYAFFVEAAVPSRVYVSTVSNPHEIPSASYFQFPSAVLSLKTYGDYLIASGTDFTWYSAGEIWDVDPAVGDWSWKVVSSTIGCISHEGMIECLDSADNEIIIFPLTTGIKYLNANLMGTDLHSVPLSRNVQPYFDQAISREKMSAIFFDQAYYIAINWSNPATTADNHNNAVFKLDLRNREWSGLWGMDITGFFVANNELYMTSSTCGRVYKYSGSDDDGEAVDMIVDSSYVGDAYNKRRFTKAVARIKKGCDTTSSTLLVRCDNTERTITLGANTAWAGAGGSSRTVQDEIVSPPRTISGGRAHNVGWRFEDNTANDMVLYGITIMAETIS